jgi:flagellar motility protein MotE (MotC chaperone)
MTRKLRLIDAVAIAAGAMLFLKVIGIASGSRASDAARGRMGQQATLEESGSFAGALVRARTNFEPEVKTTGAVMKPDETKPVPAPAPAPAAAEQPLADPPPIPASAAERAILERLGERREQWQQRGKDLEMRERLLEDAERKLESRINELKALEEKSQAATAKREDPELQAIKNLVTMYETMKPKEAARVFDRLTHDVLVPVVLQMNPRKMAEVLAVMAPEAAERLTVALATRAKGRAEPVATRQSGLLPANELPAIEPSQPRP